MSAALGGLQRKVYACYELGRYVEALELAEKIYLMDAVGRLINFTKLKFHRPGRIICLLWVPSTFSCGTSPRPYSTINKYENGLVAADFCRRRYMSNRTWQKPTLISLMP